MAEERIDECASLLRHGDALQLRGEFSPEAEWLPVLVERKVFDGAKALPGGWIAKRINDPEMIRACAVLTELDERTHWLVDRAVARERETLTPVRSKAWSLILAAQRPRTVTDLDFAWYTAARAIKPGNAGHDMRQLVARFLRPRLKIGRAWREGAGEENPEALHHRLRMEFRSTNSPRPAEILEAGPRLVDQEIALSCVVERALVDALEEADDLGLLDGTSWDVPSVAEHSQNDHHSGFYPIIRVVADIWQRIATQDCGRARTLALVWKDSPFLLARRLYPYAMSSSEIFTPAEAASALIALSDHAFWLSGAQVEIMRLLADRWRQAQPR